MRARLVLGFSFAVCMIAACGGTEESASDDSPGNDDAGEGSFADGGIGIGTDASFFDDGGVTVITDAGVEGDGGRRHRDGGAGRDGGFGFDGGFFDGGFSSDGGIVVIDAGVTPPPPHDAGTLSGPLLRDANGVVLGEIISIQSEGAVFTIVTSTDYIVDINFDGTFPNQQFSYSGLNCTGTIWLFSGGSSELLGNTAFYSKAKSSFLIPAGPLTNDAEASVPISQQSFSDPCTNGGATGDGWPLVATTAANVGLPDVIAAPLSYP